MPNQPVIWVPGQCGGLVPWDGAVAMAVPGVDRLSPGSQVTTFGPGVTPKCRRETWRDYSATTTSPPLPLYTPHTLST